MPKKTGGFAKAKGIVQLSLVPRLQFVQHRFFFFVYASNQKLETGTAWNEANTVYNDLVGPVPRPHPLTPSLCLPRGLFTSAPGIK